MAGAGLMQTLEKPVFEDLSHSECAGAPILKSLWDHFDISYLLSQSGIDKKSGVPTWMLAFLYIVGLTSKCSSVLNMSKLVDKDALLKIMFRGLKIGQYTLSRFLTGDYNWNTFGIKRVSRFQDDSDTKLQEGDSINLDDTMVDHQYGKKLPFLCWLFDHSKKVDIWTMNLVALQAVLKSGLDYPLFYRVWLKPKNEEEKLTNPTKFDLAKQMLLDLRKSVSCRLWIAMDRWYLSKAFFNFLLDNNFDWVTKAKRNTALYRKEIENITNRERFVPVKPITLIKEVFFKLKSMPTTGVVGIDIPNIYMKMPYEVVNKKGKVVKKQRFVQIAAIAAVRLKEDTEKEKNTLENCSIDETLAIYRGAYLIISNRFDLPEEALKVYIKRWRIEVFFRAAKQELGLTECHSILEIHHHAHLHLLFTAESLLNYAKWQLNKDKASDEEGYTHGKMVKSFFHTRCQIKLKTKDSIQKIYVYFDTEVQQFTRLFKLFWPKELCMFFGVRQNTIYLPLTA